MYVNKNILQNIFLCYNTKEYDILGLLGLILAHIKREIDYKTIIEV